MSPFSLLRLPFIPILNVLIFLNPIELVEFSLISKRTRQFAKIVSKSKRLRIDICDHWSKSLRIRVPKESFYLEILKLDQKKRDNCYNGIINGNHEVKLFKRREHFLETYWKEQMTGLTEISKYIAEIFNYPIVTYKWSNDDYLNKPLIDWINQRLAGKVKCMTFRTIQGYSGPRSSRQFQNDRDLSDEDMKYILDSAKIARNLIFQSEPCPDFRYEFINFNLDYIQLKGTKWLTLDNLIALSNQAKSISLVDTSLTNQQLNSFLKYWISKNLVIKMEQLQYKHSVLNSGEILLDIPKEKRDNELVHLKLYGNSILSFAGGFNIKRTNGDTALIKKSQCNALFFHIFSLSE